MVGVAGGAARPGGRRAGAAVPDLQDQPADDDGQALGRLRDGQDRRDIHGRSGRSDALGLPAVPRRSRSLQARRRRRRAPRPTSPRRRSGRAAPPWCSRSRPTRPNWPSAARRGTIDRRRLPRARDAAGLRAGGPARAALDRSSPRSTRPRRSRRSRRSPGTLVLSTAGDHLRRLHRRDAAGAIVRAADPAAGSRRPADQLRRLRRHAAGDVPRRIRRSDSRLQRHEPEPRDQGGTAQRAAPRRTTGCCCR